MNFKGASGESSDENEEHIVWNWSKGNSCYKGAKNLTELCSSVLWKVELVTDEFGCLSEKMSKCWRYSHFSPGCLWDKLKKKLLSKTWRFGKFSAYAYCKKWESILLREHWGHGQRTFVKEIIGTVTERQRRWKGRGLCTRWRNKKKPQKNN